MLTEEKLFKLYVNSSVWHTYKDIGNCHPQTENSFDTTVSGGKTHIYEAGPLKFKIHCLVGPQ